MARRSAVALVFGVLLVSSSSLTACIGYPTTGVIMGRLIAVGGPAPGAPRYLPGTIYISGGHDYTVDVPPAANGAFRIEVPAGSYVVTGRSRLYEGGQNDCTVARTPLVVAKGDQMSIQVICQVS